MHRTTEEWIKEYERRGALWIHDGNPRRPHVRLSKGEHSTGFFNSGIVMQDPSVLNQAASDIVEMLTAGGFDIELPDRVVGPAMGAITWVHDVARKIGEKRGRPCLTAYTEKTSGNGVPKMMFSRTKIEPGEKILLGEDVLTTGSSVEAVRNAVLESHGVVLPWIALIVNRSGMRFPSGAALIDRAMPKWDPEKEPCPLCAEGSEVLHPAKDPANWERLNATY